MKFSLLLFGLAQLIHHCARRHPAFKERLAEKNLTAQIMTRDGRIGRSFTFQDGRLRTKRGVIANPDVKLIFKTARIAAQLLMPPIDQLDQINAMKDFNLSLEGPDELTSWFTRTLIMTQSAGWRYGVEVGDGVKRYTNMTNGGPVFVYEKAGKILRITPIIFDDGDPEPGHLRL